MRHRGHLENQLDHACNDHRGRQDTHAWTQMIGAVHGDRNTEIPAVQPK
jgi:hypothetical protein